MGEIARPAPLDTRPTTDVSPTPEFYASHTTRVKEQLGRFGFGKAMEHLTPDGLGPSYISFARKELLSVPNHVGEVPLTEQFDLLQQRAQRMLAIYLPFNMGYGHLRPAMGHQKLVEVLGGETELGFIGGQDKVFNKFTDSVLNALTRYYFGVSLQRAYEQGMINELPSITDRDPKATAWMKRIVGVIGRLQGKSREKYLASIFSAADEGTPTTINREYFFTGKTAGLFLRGLIKQYQEKHPDRDTLIINTFPTVAGAISQFPNRVKERFTVSNFYPDVAFGLRGHVPGITNFIEADETQQRWEKRLNEKRPSWIHERHPDTVVIDGVLSPLAVFKRNELAHLRQEALQQGQPLTVIATASGIAQTQQGSFERFLREGAQHMKDGSLRMVIQCGAEEGGGLDLYNHLNHVVTELGVQEQVVLHVAANPQAAVDFVEAASWAPVPLAFYVKGSEMARMAPALGVPHIPTGVVGNHELWNIAATLVRNPDMVAFPPGLGEQFIANVKSHFAKDASFMGDGAKQYINAVVTAAEKRSAHSQEELLEMVRSQVAKGVQLNEDDQPLPRQDAMLVVLEKMLEQKYPQNTLPSKHAY